MKVLYYFSQAILWTAILTASQHVQAQIPPSITTQPQSQTADFSSDVTFTVAATGTEPLSYQWCNSSGNLGDYDNLAGSQTPVLYLVGVGQQNAQKYYVVVSNAGGSVTSSLVSLTVGPKVDLQDNFENGLGQWTPMMDGEVLGIDNSQNRTANSRRSAMITNSAQKMYAGLNPKLRSKTRLTVWIYDAGGPQMAYAELRGYSGVYAGYAKYIPNKGLRQCFAAGIYTSDFGTNNKGTLAGETLDPTRYQGKVSKGTNSGWFNLNATEAPKRSIGWHKFQIERSAFRTNVSFYIDGILAREIRNINAADLDTVSIGSTGMGENNQWPITSTTAWFDDVMVESFEKSYEYQNLASNSSIPELMQLRETGTNASDVKVSPTTVCELTGAATNSGVGAWVTTNAEIQGEGVRGYLEYTINAPADNAYRIEVEGREKDFKWPQVEIKLAIWLDGEQVAHVLLPYGPSSNGLASCFTPFIKAGVHTLGIYWDNVRPRCELALDAIRLQSLAGEASINGMQSWVANRLLAQSGMDSPSSASLVSPVCLEGRGLYLSMMTLLSGTNYPLSSVAIQHGAGNRWYANVPLSPNNGTRVEVSYQNGGMKETNDLEWQITNLLNATNAVIRVGDSLLFTAHPEGATAGTVSILVHGQATLNTDASTPVPYQFTAAGNYTVTGSYEPTGASASINVTVVNASFSGSFPVRLLNMRFIPPKLDTYWDCTNLPLGVVLDRDPRLPIFQQMSASARAARLPNAPPLGPNGRELRVRADAPEPRYVLARLGNNGPILASAALLGFQFTGPPWSSFRVLSTQADGSQLIEATFVLSPVVPGFSVDLSTETAGVTFGDGTVAKTLATSNFDQLGVCRVNFIRAAGVNASACMVRDFHAEADGGGQ